MRQARVIRYLAAAAVLLLLAACGTIPGLRTSMPPTPAETPPGAAAPAPAPDQAQPVPSLEARVAQLEARVADLEARQGVPAPARERAVPAPAPARERAVPAPAPPPAPAAPTPASAPKPAVPSAAAEKSYTEGMRLYHAKKYSEARHQLYQYLKSQPKGPKAPEARYYLADSFYQEGKYHEAAVEFNKLRLQSPKSVLAPAGLLRQALCYKNQQQMGPYRTTLQKLVKAYPNSPEAKEAQKMLKASP